MFLKIFLAVVFLGAASAQTYDKVNLTFVYETRCPFSLQFMSKQLYSGYTKLSEYINLELLIRTWPYDNGTIECQHGENECFISRAQACAYNRPGVTEAIRVEFLQCTEAPAQKAIDVVDADIEACVNSVLADLVTYETVQTCMTGDESYKLLKQQYDKENQYGVNFVPWLALFGIFDEATEKDLRADFVGTICNLLSNPPEVCNS